MDTKNVLKGLTRAAGLSVVVCAMACEQVALPIPGPLYTGGGQIPGMRVADGGFEAPDAGWPPPNPGREQCMPALNISPNPVITTPVALTSFRVEGGTGAYIFDLLKFDSGGRINETTGAYLSGETAGTEDIVRVRDANCVGTSSATIQVVTKMQVLPASADIPPFTSFAIQVNGGSGNFSFEMYRSPSGGSITAEGEYLSGSRNGEDIIRITDLGSGEVYDLNAKVDVNAEITANPTEIHVPVGNAYKLDITGGSGDYRLISDNPNVDLVDLVVFSNLPGTVAFQIEDLFTGQFGEAFVTFVLPQVVTTTRGGDLSLSGELYSPGDINADGYDDVLFGLPEADSTGNNSGSVFVYLGNASGLDTVPAQTLGGTGRDDGFGTIVMTGELTGDGIDDLIVSAPRADVNAVDSGGIFIYKGTADELYEPQRLQVIGGRGDGDQFGSALSLCDFNGDGRLDIAVTAPFAEDRGIQNIRENQGAMYIFLNHADLGFLSNADQIIYGSLRRQNGNWTGETALGLGTSIASGDFNNDGRCEVAVGALSFTNNSGLVYVHTGGDNGISSFPKYAYRGAANTLLGSEIHFGDITADGRDELILTQPAASGGAIHVYRGQQDIAEDDVIEIADVNEIGSDWNYVDPTAGNLTGSSVVTADANNDGIEDLIFGRLAGERAGGTADVGTISIFTGRNGPLPGRTAWKEYAGMAAGDNFGLSAAVVNDLDGDRLNDFVVFAPFAGLYGPQVGVPYFVPSNPNEAYVPLEIPSDASGVRVGASLAVVDDINSDRDSDLIVGAPLADLRGKGLDSGTAMIYLGGMSGFDRDASMTIDDFPELSAGDQFGSKVINLGDFDGDSIGDFAITAPFDDAPGQFGAHINPAGCRARAQGNSGAVYIFRGNDLGLPQQQPAFVYWPPQSEVRLNIVAGNIDFNGDGIKDIAIGMPNFNRGNRTDAGRFEIYYGRAADATGRTTVLCNPNFFFRGLRANDRLGNSVTGLGDIDGDNCTDIAVSSSGEGFLAGNQDTNEGYIRVFFGGSSNCNQPDPVLVAFGSEEPNARAGYHMAGGYDVDGDTIPDLAVSSITTVVAAETVGSVWLIPGAHILGTPTITVRDDIAPSRVNPFAPVGSTTLFRINGETAAGNYGETVELIPEASGPGVAGIAIGAPRYRYSDIPLTGTMLVYRFNQSASTVIPRGINAKPFVAISGETTRSGGRMGSAISTGVIAGKRVIVVGSDRASGNGVDQGAVYVVTPDSL